MLAGAFHRLLLALRNRNDHAQRIDLFIIRPPDRAGIGAAEEEELAVVGLVGQHAEEVVDVIDLLDLIDAREQPGIADLGIQLLILLRELGEFVHAEVLQLNTRIAADEGLIPVLRQGPGAVVDIVLDLHFAAVLIPVVQQPAVGRILAHGQIHLVGDLR